MRTMLLAWHITAAAGWFALVAAEVMIPWEDLKFYLIETAAVTVGTGLWLALGSPLGLLRYRWVVIKLLGTLGLLTLGVLALRGVRVPWARPVGLVVLWILVWVSVAKLGGKTKYGRRVARRGRHTI